MYFFKLSCFLAPLPFHVIDDNQTTSKLENGVITIEDEEKSTPIPTTNDKTSQQNVPAHSNETTPMETEPPKDAPFVIPPETSSIQTNEQITELPTPIKLPDTNTNNDNNIQNSPHKSSAPSAIKDGILKYTQPLTASCQSNRNQSITTPPNNTVIDLSSSNPDVSVAVSTTPKHNEPPNLATTPGNRPKVRTDTVIAAPPFHF